MTDKEYAKNIKTISTEKLLNNLESYGYDHYYDYLYKVTMRELKERSHWHKVADGDIPKYSGDIIIAIKFDNNTVTTTGRYRLCDFYISDIGYIQKGKVIAWTELPEYKE